MEGNGFNPEVLGIRELDHFCSLASDLGWEEIGVRNRIKPVLHVSTLGSVAQWAEPTAIYHTSASLKVRVLSGCSRWPTHDQHKRGDGKRRSVTRSMAHVTETPCLSVGHGFGLGC